MLRAKITGVSCFLDCCLWGRKAFRLIAMIKMIPYNLSVGADIHWKSCGCYRAWKHELELKGNTSDMQHKTCNFDHFSVFFVLESRHFKNVNSDDTVQIDTCNIDRSILILIFLDYLYMFKLYKDILYFLSKFVLKGTSIKKIFVFHLERLSVFWLWPLLE